MASRPHSLDSLAELDLDILKSRWRKMFGSSAPTGAKRDLLIRLLAYGLQEREYGSLPKAALKQLNVHKAFLDGDLSQGRSGDEVSQLRLGGRLVRSWNGATYEVTVLDFGFAYRGKHYRSLSEIAQLITGAHWSGPRFFGVKKSRNLSKITASVEQA
jgi:DUF2924 family protein